jgi:hypothetical protein
MSVKSDDFSDHVTEAYDKNIRLTKVASNLRYALVELMHFSGVETSQSHHGTLVAKVARDAIEACDEEVDENSNDSSQ